MGFIEIAMDDAPEPGMAPEARYDLQIISAKYGDTKGGAGKKVRKKIAVAIVIQGGDYEPVFETFTLPDREDWDTDSGKMAKMFILSLKRFMYTFGISWETNGFDHEIFPGAEASNVMLTTQTGDDGIERNKIMYPRMPEGM